MHLSISIRQLAVLRNVGLWQIRNLSKATPPEINLNRLPPGYIAPGSYALFMQEFRKKNSNIVSSIEVLRASAKKWGTLTDANKEVYNKKSKAIAEEKKSEYEQLPDDTKLELHEQNNQRKMERAARRQRKAIREKHEETGRPKRPLNGYMIFVKEYHKKNPVSGNSPTEIKAAMSNAAKIWSAMNEAGKQVYVAKAEPAKKEFAEAMKEWKASQAKIKEEEEAADTLESPMKVVIKAKRGAMQAEAKKPKGAKIAEKKSAKPKGAKIAEKKSAKPKGAETAEKKSAKPKKV